jgi:serine/threonine protein kinase
VTVTPLPNALADTDPHRVGPFRILGRIGRGGEGRVYLAADHRDTHVAVKVIRPRDDDRDPTCTTEFGFLCRVDPAAVAPPVHCGIDPAGPYLATRYLPDAVPGDTLDAGHLDEARLWRIAADTARAIAAVHDAGIIHCDVKPANVLVSEHDVRLIDFGIARDVADQPEDAPQVYCSRIWAAPEQLCAGRLTTAVDVFGWGCLVAFLASGEAPFASESEAEWILRVRTTEPDLVGLPLGLDSLVRAALSRGPKDRPDIADLARVCSYEVRHQVRPATKPLPTASGRNAWASNRTVPGQPSRRTNAGPRAPRRATTSTMAA